MEWRPEFAKIKVGFAETNLWFWQKEYDRLKMHLPLYSSEEYTKQFGESDLRDCMRKMADALWHIGVSKDEIEHFGKEVES